MAAIPKHVSAYKSETFQDISLKFCVMLCWTLMQAGINFFTCLEKKNGRHGEKTYSGCCLSSRKLLQKCSDHFEIWNLEIVKVNQSGWALSIFDAIGK